MTQPDDPKKSRLSPTKLALLDAWVRRGRTEPPALESAAASADDRYEPFPLTEVQEAYWLGRHRSFELGTVPSSYLEIEIPDLDVTRLELALDRLVRHHDMLRAVVLPDGRQRVLPTTPRIEVSTHDLRGLPGSEQARRRDAIRHSLAAHLADPCTWPLFAVAVSIDDARRILHVMFDILIVDMQSVRVLTRDLSRLYADPSVLLPSIQTSFRELVLARCARKASPSYARAREYWLGRLDTLPPAPPLPLARSPRELVGAQFVRHAGGLDRSRWDVVKARASSLKLTPTAPLLAAFAQVLARRSASSRFTINVTMYNRPAHVEHIDEVVGDFTSLTLVECDLSVAESFADRATRLQRRLWTDLEHREFDGVEVLRERMARLRSRAAGMPIVFTSNLLHERGADPQPTPVLGRVVTAITQTPQVWIDHQVAEQDGALVYSWDVVDGLFPSDFIEELLAEYQERIEALCDDQAWAVVEPLVTLCTAVPPRVDAEQPPRREVEVVRSSDHVLARVIERAREVLGGRDVAPEIPLLELGLTSIGMVRLANALEVDLRVRPELERLFEQPTAAAIAGVYEELVGRREPEVANEQLEDGLIVDPDERAKFTEAQHGLRRDLDDRSWTELGPTPPTRVTLDLAARRTHRTFALKPVPLAALAGVLAALRAISDGTRDRYLYPSAGGLYPVQVYVHAKPGRVEGLEGGYYYAPARHALASLAPTLQIDRKHHGWNNRSAYDQCAFSMFFVLDMRAMRPLYGRLARDFGLLEAGAMLELAMLTATAVGLGLCPVGRTDSSVLRDALCWHEDHTLLHTVLGGIPTETSGDATADLLREIGNLSDAEVEALLARRDRSGG